MKNCKHRTLKEIQAHNRMSSFQRLKHQHNWNVIDWLLEEHPLVSLLLTAAMMIGAAVMIGWAFLHPYG